MHLETALRGVIIGDRWPKSGVEVIITILEGEEDCWWGNDCGATRYSGAGQWGTMSVLSGCITVASAAIADAGIDCVDMVSGGVAALVRIPQPSSENPVTGARSSYKMVLDPLPSEHHEILAACVLGYLPSRDEITNIWVKGGFGGVTGEQSLENTYYEELADNAVQAALGSHRVVAAAITEAADMRLKQQQV